MFVGSQSVVLLVLVAFFLWLSGLSVVFWRLLSHYKRVAKRVPEGDLIKVLNKVLGQEQDNVNHLKNLDNEIKRLDNELLRPIQKLGIVKFNPFAEIGGDHSFTVCLLDNHNSGFVLTGLHTRDRTRAYLKEIKLGESKLELSSEEKKALRMAIRSK